MFKSIYRKADGTSRPEYKSLYRTTEADTAPAIQEIASCIASGLADGFWQAYIRQTVKYRLLVWLSGVLAAKAAKMLVR